MAKETAVQTASTAVKSETKYSLEKLRANCKKLFGVSESTFIGATTGLADKEYSVREIKNAIETWYKKEAK